MVESQSHKVFFFGLLLTASIAVSMLIIYDKVYYAFLTVIALFVLTLIMRSDHRLPVMLMYVSLLAADSSSNLLNVYGFKLRWAILGLLAFKEFDFWAFQKQINVKVTSAHVIFFLFLIYALTSSVYSVEAMESVSRSGSVLLFFIVVFFYFWQQSNTPESRLKLITFMALFSPIIYFAEIIFYVFFPGLSWSGGRLRAMSGNPNGLGQIIMLTLPFIYWYLLSGQKPRYRFYLYLSFFVGIILLILSASRGSLISLAICMLIITIKLIPRYFISVVLLFMLMFIGLTVYSLNVPAHKISSTVVSERFEKSGLGGRHEAWEKSVGVGLEKPFLGHGFGTAMITFGKLKFEEHYGAYPHNFILHTFVDLGVVGVVFVVLLHVVLLSYFYRVFSGNFMMIDCGLPYLAAGIYFSGLFNAFFESWMFSAGSPTAFPYWLMTMLMVRYATDRNVASAVRSFRPSMSKSFQPNYLSQMYRDTY